MRLRAGAAVDGYLQHVHHVHVRRRGVRTGSDDARGGDRGRRRADVGRQPPLLVVVARAIVAVLADGALVVVGAAGRVALAGHADLRGPARAAGADLPAAVAGQDVGAVPLLHVPQAVRHLRRIEPAAAGDLGEDEHVAPRVRNACLVAEREGEPAVHAALACRHARLKQVGAVVDVGVEEVGAYGPGVADEGVVAWHHGQIVHEMVHGPQLAETRDGVECETVTRLRVQTLHVAIV
mmetsp:Transcript_10366/g.27495  ORF Transcript_10366/g.27495 Transcript_10366/m.27495 type:complete len:237 (+) Transcript_10366:921-1631(+)